MSRGHGKTQRFVLEQLDELATGDEPGIWIRAGTLARRLHGEDPTAYFAGRFARMRARSERCLTLRCVARPARARDASKRQLWPHMPHHHAGARDVSCELRSRAVVSPFPDRVLRLLGRRDPRTWSRTRG
jgi:hypothetical protein